MKGAHDLRHDLGLFQVSKIKGHRPEEDVVKSAEEVMEILEAFDLTGSYRAAGELAGCDHKPVKHYVERRDAGLTLDAGLARVRRLRLATAQRLDPPDGVAALIAGFCDSSSARHPRQ